MAEEAICSGVTGTAGFLVGESAAEPVTAQEIITLRCTTKPPQLLFFRTDYIGPPEPDTAHQARITAPCHSLCAALSQTAFLERIRTEKPRDSTGSGALWPRRDRIPGEAAEGCR